MERATVIWAAGAAAHAVLFSGVALHLFRHRRRADSTLLWLGLTWTVPLAGAVLYAMFGVDRVPKVRWKRGLARKAGLRHAREGAAGEVLPEAYWRGMGGHTAAAEGAWARELDRILGLLSDGVPLMGGNLVEPLCGGDEAFPMMLEAIAGAKRQVHLQSFIIGNDRTGREFLDALAAKAAEGVAVRVLYDRFGSSAALWGGLFRRYRGVKGMELAGWTQANLFRKQLQFNLRNHRKTLVVDGRVGFTGGVNLSDESRSGPGREPIRDYHFRVRGPVVQQLQYGFLRDWHVMTGAPAEGLLTAENFPRPERAGEDRARVALSGPSSSVNRAADLFFAAVCAARKRVRVVTPYFLPTDDLVRALRLAALRGVSVELTLPARANHGYVTWAGRALWEDLLEAGVRIWARRAPFIHAKAMTVDGELSVVGSANWDLRSLQSNFETCLAVYGGRFASGLQRLMGEERAMSDEVRLELFKKRPLRERYLENVCGLLGPLL